MSATGDMTEAGLAPARPIIRKLRQDDISAALSAGYRDLKAAPQYGLFFGLIYTLGGWVIIAMLNSARLNYVIYPLITGFALIAPFVAAGCYEVSRRLERGEELSWRGVLGSVFRQGGRELGWMALVTTFAMIIWFDFAVFLYLMFFGLKVPTFLDLVTMIANTTHGALFFLVGNITGAAIAFFVFSLTVISCPMLMDRDMDFITAMLTSLKAVHQNPRQMISWAVLIGFMLAVCVVTLLVALPIVLPLLGHASWHVYRKAVA